MNPFPGEEWLCRMAYRHLPDHATLRKWLIHRSWQRLNRAFKDMTAAFRDFSGKVGVSAEKVRAAVSVSSETEGTAGS